jgi:hypothetical protein
MSPVGYANPSITLLCTLTHPNREAGNVERERRALTPNPQAVKPPTETSQAVKSSEVV